MRIRRKLGGGIRTSKHAASKPDYNHLIKTNQEPQHQGNTAKAITRTLRSAPSGALNSTKAQKKKHKPAVYKKDARLAREAAAARREQGGAS